MKNIQTIQIVWKSQTCPEGFQWSASGGLVVDVQLCYYITLTDSHSSYSVIKTWLINSYVRACSSLFTNEWALIWLFGSVVSVMTSK